ncbi:MAG: hypothetical protein D6788_09170 [Planctomycetota bacterium]|nr:MAG: hypothetical protein D6788_09170 [Planctomycetota bacterium]
MYGLSEARCPECGTAFQWETLLHELSRRKRFPFEADWWKHPLRRFSRTTLQTLRPRRFWRTIQLHNPPLAESLLGAAGAVVFILVLLGTLSDAVRSFLQLRMAAFAPLPAGNLVVRIMRSSATWFFAVRWSISLFCWLLSTLAPLFVFQESMHRAKVKNVHLLRVWVYGAVLPLFFFKLIEQVEWPIRGVFSTITGTGAYDGEMFDALWGLGCSVAFLLTATWSIRQAYRHYLRMPHASAVAASWLVIAVLFEGVLELSLNPLFR